MQSSLNIAKFISKLNFNMDKQTLSNFYIPGTSKRIFTTLQAITVEVESIWDEEEEESWDDFHTPQGIIDGSKLNFAYKELIESLGISKISNQELKKSINNHLTNNLGINLQLWIKFLEEDNNSDCDMMIDSNKPSVSVEAIFLWRRYGYSIKSIAAMLSIAKEKVNEILVKYRKNVKIVCYKNKRKTKGLRISTGTDQLEAIKKYWNHPLNRPIKIKDIKNYVWPPDKPERAPHDSTISRILRTEWRMSYKVLQKRNPATKNANNIRLFHEAFAIQVFLRARDYELIYIDEFSYSSRK